MNKFLGFTATIKSLDSNKIFAIVEFLLSKVGNGILKFIYSEKATKFCKISTLLLSYVVTVKSKVEIFQNFVAFSEYINFNIFIQIWHFNLIKINKRIWKKYWEHTRA